MSEYFIAKLASHTMDDEVMPSVEEISRQFADIASKSDTESERQRSELVDKLMGARHG